MITVTVKTLDSKNHVFEVSDDMTVKDFKEEIVSKVSIPADEQRLIFRGRVLQNEKKLAEYNVANNTVHLVQRTAQSGSSSQANDNPPVGNAAGGRFGGEGGILFGSSAADHNAIIMGTIGIPSVQVGQNTVATSPTPTRQNSAARRLQIGNEMIDRASTLLVRLEEDDAVAQARSSLEAPENSATGQDSEENQSFNGDSMDIDPDDPAGFGRVISQVANAASAAAVMASMRAINESLGNPGGAGTNAPRGDAPISEAGATGGPGPNPQATSASAAGANTVRPSAPRIQELSAALQDLVAFHNRLTPFLEFMQEVLRTNRDYSQETGELRSVQYTFDTLSAIMHCLGHSYHAYSDLICDFATPAETRRLAAPATILVEQSTVVRATIPIAVPAGFPTANFTSQQPGGSANSEQTSQSQSVPPNPQTQQANPLLGFESFLQGLNPNILSAAAGGTQGGQAPSGENMPGISINIQANGVPDLAAMMGPALGGRPGGQGGQLPPWLFGNIPGVNQTAPHPNSQNQSAQQTPAPGEGSARPANPASGTSNSAGPQINQQRLRSELARPPFDAILYCHSHHNSRSRNLVRPSDLRQHLRVGEVASSPSEGLSPEFFDSVVNIIRFSSWLEMLHPYLKDFVQNYLMRGRDVKNSLHIKTCARSLAKKYISVFNALTDSVKTKEDSISYERTFSEFLTKFFVELLNLALNSEADRQFRTSFLNIWDQFMFQLFSIFRHCFPENNHVPAIFASIISDSLFPGMPVVFRRHVTERLQKYFGDVAISTVSRLEAPDRLGLVYNESSVKEPEAMPAASPQISQPIVSSTSSASLAAAPAENQVSGATALPPQSAKEPPAFDDAMDTYIDDLVDRIPVRAPEPDPLTQGPMQNIPDEWKTAVQRDVMRQFGMPRQPPPSPGFETLFPKKH